MLLCNDSLIVTQSIWLQNLKTGGIDEHPAGVITPSSSRHSADRVINPPPQVTVH